MPNTGTGFGSSYSPRLVSFLSPGFLPQRENKSKQRIPNNKESEMKRKQVATERQAKSELLPSRLMEGKALHYSVDDSVFRRRIGSQPFIQTAEETEQLSDDGVDDGSILIAQFAQSGAFDDHVVGADQF